MSRQEPVFGKRGAPAAKPPPPSETPSEAFLAASLAARSAFRRGDSAGESEAAPPPAGQSAPVDQEADMARYIGANWRSYRGLWLAMKDAPALAPSRCWAAAAFTSLWLLYRKRYALGFVVMALQFGVTSAAPELGALIDLAVALFFGRYGKSIVVRGGLAAIARIRSAHGAAGDAGARIARAGGTSILAPIAGAALGGWLVLAGTGEVPGDGSGLLDALRALQDATTQSR